MRTPAASPKEPTSRSLSSRAQQRPPTQSALRPESYEVAHSVLASNAGERLDHFLRGRYSRRSRASLQRAIAEGAIRIQRTGDHAPVGRLRPSSTLLLGDTVMVRSVRKPEPMVCFDYVILHEDEEILVISKPAPLPVHPSGRYFFNTGFRQPAEPRRQLNRRCLVVAYILRS